MTAKKSLLSRSLLEMKNVRKLVFSAMLLAMVVALKLVGFNSEYVKAGLSGIPAYLAYQILGPVGGMFFAILSDLLGVIVLGQSVNPGITFAAALSGFIMGLTLYTPRISFLRLITGVLLKTLICSLLINTFFIALYYFPLDDPALWDKYLALLGVRCVKNLIEVPVTTCVYYFLEKGLEKAGLFRKINGEGEI